MSSPRLAAYRNFSKTIRRGRHSIRQRSAIKRVASSDALSEFAVSPAD